MYKIITAVMLALAVGACGDKPTVVTNTSVVYPSLPDIDKPLPPVLKPVKFDYPRDVTKPKKLKDTLECKQEPRIPDFDKVCMEHPRVINSNISIGLDSQSFSNLLSNQEQVNSYGRSLNARIDEVNAERARWRESNQQKGQQSNGSASKGR